MLLERMSESWITVNIMNFSGETIPHIKITKKNG